MRPFKLLGADLPLGAHLAMGGVVVLSFSATFMDIRLGDLMGAAYFAAVGYALMNLCLTYLREHTPATPKRVRPMLLVATGASVVGLTVAFHGVMGYSPLVLTQSNLAVATGTFILLFGGFADAVTNPSALRGARDPRRPYARVVAWVPTWRAATLPMLGLLGLVHVAGRASLAPDAAMLLVLVALGAHVATLVTFAGRPSTAPVESRSP